jgi:RHS repeat-associated protein
MLMPGRTFSAQTGYRYGFNGKENDNEIKGEGNQQDYGMRIYDPRVGRFLSVDPLSVDFPWNSPYSYAEGDPINYLDLDGAEKNVIQAAATPLAARTVSKIVIDETLRKAAVQLAEQAGKRGGTILAEKAAQTWISRSLPWLARIGGTVVNLLIPLDAGPKFPHGDEMYYSMSYSNFRQKYPNDELRDFDKPYKKWNESIKDHEIITSDPSLLDDAYLNIVQRRLIEGNSTEQDNIYANELRKRRVLYEINPKHDPSKPLGGPDASVIPNNHMELWDNRTTYESSNDVWWSYEGTGKKAIFHKFASDGNGAYHWAGSTGKNMNRRGKEVTPIPISKVPSSIKRKAAYGK